MRVAVCFAIKCQPCRIGMRLLTGYLERQASSIDAAIAMIEGAHAEGKPVSVGLLGNAAEILPEIVRRGIHPDLLTDRSEEHTSELQSLMRISYAVFCLKKKKKQTGKKY